ncbi:hypothetical protein D3C73_1517240 [compost metagenome]
MDGAIGVLLPFDGALQSERELFGNVISHRRKQLLYILKMAVGRSMADAALGCNLAEGEAADSLFVDEADTGFD